MKIKIVRRLETSRRTIILVRILSVALALLTASLVFLMYKLDPITVYGSIFSNAFATQTGLTESVVRMIPLLLVYDHHLISSLLFFLRLLCLWT